MDRTLSRGLVDQMAVSSALARVCTHNCPQNKVQNLWPQYTRDFPSGPYLLSPSVLAPNIVFPQTSMDSLYSPRLALKPIFLPLPHECEDYKRKSPSLGQPTHLCVFCSKHLLLTLFPLSIPAAPPTVRHHLFYEASPKGRGVEGNGTSGPTS